MEGTGSMQATPWALGDAGLAALAGRVAAPTYDRGRLRRSIVHLGVGGFHRAHQAVYLDDLAERRVSSEWGERGAGLLPGDQVMADALVPQDCLYTVVERGADGDTARVIGSLGDYVFAPADPARLQGRRPDPPTRIVSLTITEGGYPVDDKTGLFDAGNPAVRRDLASGPPPTTACGHLCAALASRRAAGIPPFTVLSCDN